jgi:hypothetical protein
LRGKSRAESVYHIAVRNSILLGGRNFEKLVRVVRSDFPNAAGSGEQCIEEAKLAQRFGLSRLKFLSLKYSGETVSRVDQRDSELAAQFAGSGYSG